MKRISILSVALVTTAIALAQGTVEDYKRAYSIRGKYSNKVTGNVTANRYGYNNPKQNTHFWYSIFPQ